VCACSRWCARRTDLYLGASRPADDRRSASVSAKKRTTGRQEGDARGSFVPLSDPTAGHATEVAADPICEMEEILCRIMDGGTRAHDTPPLNRPASPRPRVEKNLARYRAVSRFPTFAPTPRSLLTPDTTGRPSSRRACRSTGTFFPGSLTYAGTHDAGFTFLSPRGRNSNNCFELITPRRAMRRRDHRCASREADKRMFPVKFSNAVRFRRIEPRRLRFSRR